MEKLCTEISPAEVPKGFAPGLKDQICGPKVIHETFQATPKNKQILGFG